MLKKLVFLGTGTSSQIPLIPCLTQSPVSCAVCVSGRDPASKNRRRNTSLALTIEDSTGTERTVLIDCGKSFYDGALAFFPVNGITSLDGLILTHGHADAILGLDDLRMWTNVADEGAVALDIFLDHPTFNVVSSTFPYLVNSHGFNGGGGVASLNFNVFHESLPEFEVAGLEFLPIQGSD